MRVFVSSDKAVVLKLLFALLNDLALIQLCWSRGGSHMKRSGMLVVPLRGQNLEFWYRLGCYTSDSNILVLARYRLGAPVPVKWTFATKWSPYYETRVSDPVCFRASEWAMKSQVLHTVWCYISGEAGGGIWHWSFLGVRGLTPDVFGRCCHFRSRPKSLMIDWMAIIILNHNCHELPSTFIYCEYVLDYKLQQISNLFQWSFASRQPDPFNPFTTKSDQCQISPAGPREILHHTVWRT